MTLTALEKECQIGHKTIYRWDEHAPSVTKAQRVANFFGVTVDFLIQKDDELSKAKPTD